MTRHVSAVVLVKDGYLVNLSYGAAIMTGYIMDAEGGAIVIRGSYEDAGPVFVAKLSKALYGNTETLRHEWL
jgi:hypothetical protein